MEVAEWILLIGVLAVPVVAHNELPGAGLEAGGGAGLVALGPSHACLAGARLVPQDAISAGQGRSRWTAPGGAPAIIAA